MKLKTIESKFKNYSKNISRIVEDSLEQFMEQAVHTKMVEIEQGVKRNEMKLKNMKKKTMLLKDKQE